jgi:tight adherence protein B
MQMGHLAALLSSGVNLKTALAELKISSLSEQLSQAIQLGAPLIPLLKSLEAQELSQIRAEGELEQAMAVPQATRKLLIWLPALTLLVSLAVGIVSLDSLINPLATAGLLAGSALLVVGSRISNRMLETTNFDFKLRPLQDFSIAISSGLNLSQIKNKFPELILDHKVKSLLEISQRTGARLSQLIESELELSLSEQLAQKISNLRKLSVRLLIPLGLTTLPAFMLFIIPPILVGFTK